MRETRSGSRVTSGELVALDKRRSWGSGWIAVRTADADSGSVNQPSGLRMLMSAFQQMLTPPRQPLNLTATRQVDVAVIPSLLTSKYNTGHHTASSSSMQLLTGQLNASWVKPEFLKRFPKKHRPPIHSMLGRVGVSRSSSSSDGARTGFAVVMGTWLRQPPIGQTP